MIELKRLSKSFVHAWRGIRVIFRTEQSFRLQVFMGTLVLFCAFLFQVRLMELILLLLLIGAVLTLELINSVFERIVDAFKPRLHPVVRDIKDIMAGTVLVVSVIAAVLGVVIFWPYVLEVVFS